MQQNKIPNQIRPCFIIEKETLNTNELSDIGLNDDSTNDVFFEEGQNPISEVNSNFDPLQSSNDISNG